MLSSSPGQRASVHDVEDLVRVEELPETIKELSPLQTATLRVDKHQQRTHVCSQRVVLKGKPDAGEMLGRGKRHLEAEWFYSVCLFPEIFLELFKHRSLITSARFGKKTPKLLVLRVCSQSLSLMRRI